MMQRRFWFAFAFLTTAIAVWLWYLAPRPPVKFVPFASITMGQPIASCWLNRHPDHHVLVVVTKDAKVWRIMVKGQTLVSEPVQIPLRYPSKGFFDFDRDGYVEFLAINWDEANGLCLWVFKQRKSIRGKRLPRQIFPSWFSLPKSEWVLWSKIHLEDHAGYLTFIIEPNPKKQRKVVVWTRWHSSGGPFLLLSRSGRHLRPFTEDLWHDIRTEDFDHDGVYELVLTGRFRDCPAAVGIYKWDGSTYRLWWPTDERDGYVLHAEVQDLDEDGTKDIVTVLDTKGISYDVSPFRALAIYCLRQGRYRKVARCSLPKMTSINECWWAPALVGVLRLRCGCLIMLERESEFMGYFYRPSSSQLRRVWQIKGDMSWLSGCSHANGSDIFVSFAFRPRLPNFLRKIIPPFARDWLEQRFDREQVATLWLVWDGTTLKQKARWIGSRLSKASGTCDGNFWVALAKKGERVWHYTIVMVDGRRLRKLWQGDFHASPDNVFGGDLDGDGNEELVVVETSEGKISVFKAKQTGK